MAWAQTRALPTQAYSISAFQGTAAEGVRLPISAGDSTCELGTPTEHQPKTSAGFCCDVDISWLLQCVGDGDAPHVGFKIARDTASCRTPRRNEEVQAACQASSKFETWSEAVAQYCDTLAPRLCGGATIKSTALRHGRQFFLGHFMPILPLFEKAAPPAADAAAAEPEPETEGGALLVRLRDASAAGLRAARMLNTRGVSFFNDLNTNNTRVLVRKTYVYFIVLYCILFTDPRI